MKNILTTFVIVFITTLISIFFFGPMIDSFWGRILIFAFLMTVIIAGFISQSIKIEELEIKIEKMGKKTDDEFAEESETKSSL